MDGIKRQTLVRSNYPCDLYSGEDLCTHIASLLKRLNPLRCKVVLLYDDLCDEYLKERLSRSVIDADYKLIQINTSHLASRTLSISSFQKFVEKLEENQCTADDIILAVGSSNTLSLANYVVRTFRKGIGYIAYPLDCIAAFSVAVSPEPLYVGDEACLTAEPCCDQVMLDWTYLDQDKQNHPYLLSLLFKGSLAAGDDLYRWLYEFAEPLTTQDESDLEDKASLLLWRNALLMGLHELASSKNVLWADQIQSAFSDMLTSALPETIMYETVGFATRLAAAHGKADISFIQELDGFMKKLGYVPYKSVSFTGEGLYAAMRTSFFASHNRMLLQVATSVGVIQPILIKDDILKAHCDAWIKAHK